MLYQITLYIMKYYQGDTPTQFNTFNTTQYYLMFHKYLVHKNNFSFTLFSLGPKVAEIYNQCEEYCWRNNGSMLSHFKIYWDHLLAPKNVAFEACITFIKDFRNSFVNPLGYSLSILLGQLNITHFYWNCLVKRYLIICTTYMRWQKDLCSSYILQMIMIL